MEQYPEQSPEHNQESTLFGFGIDQSSRSHLWEAAKWAKFLAIIGFIMCGLMAIGGIYLGSVFSSVSPYEREYGSSSIFAGMGVFVGVFYVGLALVAFFGWLFLLRFANNMKNALNTDDQGTLNISFQNLKITFRYVGIITIIIISLYILLILFAALTAMSGM